MLTSQAYKQKSSCENGIESVQTHCSDDACFERNEGSDGRPYFNLKANNGQVIGNSQMYASKDAMEAGIKSVVSAAKDASIEDLSA